MGRPESVYDFRLVLQLDDRHLSGYCVRLLTLEGEELAEDSAGPFDGSEWKKTWLAPLENYIDKPVTEEFLRELGKELAALLLLPKVRVRLFAELIRGNVQARIRLRLTNENPDFDGLPWEYLYLDAPPELPDLNGFLLRPDLDSARLHLIRQRCEPCAVEVVPFEKLRVLIAWADPRSDLPAIRAEIESVRATLTGKTRFELCGPIYCSTPGTLQQAIEDYHPHLLYFTGHGVKRHGGALLVGDRGTNGVPVSGEQLAKWLDPKTTALVVLSACDTEPFAQTLTRAGIPAVIAMQLPMRASSSALFANALVSALLEPCAVEEAVARARQATRGVGPDWGVPTLYLAGYDSELFCFGEPPSYIPYDCDPHFASPPQLLAEIHEALLTTHRPVALVGVPGLGKTQIALKYAETYKESFPGGQFFLDARDEKRIQESLAEIGYECFGIPDDVPSQQCAKNTMAYLRMIRRSFLLIYDHVTEDAQRALKWFPQGDYCHILVTSRLGWLVESQFHPIRPSRLDSASASALLQTFRTAEESPKEQAAVQDIVEKLGYLWQPILLSAKFLRQARGVSFAGFLRGLPQVVTSPINEAIKVSYDPLSSVAKDLFALTSCFDGQGIARELVARAYGRYLESQGISPPSSESELNELDYELGSIVERSLLEYEKDGRLTMLAPMRAYAQGQKERPVFHKMLASAAHTLADCLREANESEIWQPMRREIAHCRVVAQLCEDNPVQEGYPELLFELGFFYCEHSELEEAERLLRHGCDLVAKHWPDRPLLLARFRLNLADVLRARQRFKSALEEAGQAMATAKSVLPEQAPELAEYHNGLGRIYRSEADKRCEAQSSEWYARLQEAQDCYETALCLLEPVKSERPEDYASCLNNIGIVFEERGDLATARDFVFQSYVILRRASRDQNRFAARLAIRYNNLGRLLGQMGDFRAKEADPQGCHRLWQKARNYHLKARDNYAAILAQPQLRVGWTHLWLARADARLDEREQAEAEKAEAWLICKRYDEETGNELRRELRQLEEEIQSRQAQR